MVKGVVIVVATFAFCSFSKTIVLDTASGFGPVKGDEAKAPISC